MNCSLIKCKLPSNSVKKYSTITNLKKPCFSFNLSFNFVLRNRNMQLTLLSKFPFSSAFENSYNLIQQQEELYNLEEAFIRRIPKMNNTALAYACEDMNKKKINNPYIWELVYNRIKEIKNSFTLTEIVVMFHSYCNSISFNINFTHLIKIFWDLLNDKLDDLDYLSLIALYICAEKSKNIQQMQLISTFLLKCILEDYNKMKLTEKGLAVFLKIFCSNQNILDKKHIDHINYHIQKIDIKEVKNVMLCLHFFFKYKLFDEPFISLLKKIQSLIIFKNIDPNIVLKYLSMMSSIDSYPNIMQEIKNTLSIIYLSHHINEQGL
ncbi:conserved protein, unknown function [Hepatocystis sp. ex Piliocolobus tephrosceles]|nr:conserved protein, unknown function [Hepatocystis sp. ex Piliocolobus tephrosceles]